MRSWEWQQGMVGVAKWDCGSGNRGWWEWQQGWWEWQQGIVGVATWDGGSGNRGLWEWQQGLWEGQEWAMEWEWQEVIMMYCTLCSGNHKQKFYWGHKEVMIPGEMCVW